MSSLSAFSPGVRPHVVRTVAVVTFVCLLGVLGFVVPFWMVLAVGALVVTATGVTRALRRASRQVDQILAEELGPNGSPH